MSAAQHNRLLSNGYGGVSYFSLRKSLAEEVAKTAATLDDHFREIFAQISFFQRYLNTQRGMAVTALQSNLGNHQEFLSKSAPTILYFVDSTQVALQALESTDLGDTDNQQPNHRQQWAYEYSIKRSEDVIDIQTFSLAKEAALLKSNFSRISEILSEFNRMIDNVLSYTTIPWGEFSSIWNEAQFVCENIAEEMDEQVSTILLKTDVLIEEMNRLDHFLAFSNLA